jgi:hypothetical protein
MSELEKQLRSFGSVAPWAVGQNGPTLLGYVSDFNDSVHNTVYSF